MYNSQYYTCEQVDQRLLQGYLDDYNSENNTILTKAQFLNLLATHLNSGLTTTDIVQESGNNGNKIMSQAIVTQLLSNINARDGYYQATINGGTITVNAPNYLLGSGGNLRIKMPSAGTTASTLTIGNANAIPLLYNGAAVSAQNTWEANEIISVFYDGTRFMASNSQGGGGKAEKIKYSNSQSGLAADNVQEALDEVDDELTELEGTVDGELYEKKEDSTISSDSYTFTGSKYIGYSSGAVVSGAVSAWSCTENYIPIDKWLSVYTTAGGSSSAAAVAFYRADKTYISGAPCGTTATVQVPEDAAYARFSKAGGSHTITTYILTSKIDSINENIDAIEEDLETRYLKKPEEIDYLPNVVQGKAYKSGGIGTTIITNTNSAFYSAKIPCKKGDIFGIITKGFGNAHPAIITDADNKVLWGNNVPVPNNITVGGVLEIAQDNAAYLYVSSYQSTITKLTKLATNSDDSIEVDSSYAKYGMLSVADSIGSYSGYVGFAIPLLLRKGDVVKIKFKSYLNYRGYILKNASGTIVGSLSDTDLSAETLFCWNGEEDVYLYVNGLSSNPPHIIRYSRNAAKAMKNYGKKMVALGDSITSYGSCDFGELVRGRLGVSFLKTSTQIDWGNIAEGNATICNWENTTDTCQHNSALVDGTYVNRTLPNQVLQLLQHVTAEGEQITWHISSNNSDHSLDTSVGVGAGYTTDIPDIIYIAMGTNDVVTTDDFSTVIAQSYSQLTKLTICSALRWSIETLQNKFPDAVIICVTPIVRTQRPTAEMEAKCELIKKMCAYMAIPVVDGYHISGFSPLSQKIYSSDNIHPTSYTQRIARSIAAQVDALV